MSGTKLYLLGPPRLEREGVPMELERRKNVALVVYLAVTGEPHTREALITLLWPDLEPARARAGLRRNLPVLHKALGGQALLVDREMVGLDPGAGLWVDVVQFRRLLAAWQSHGHSPAEVCPQCLAALSEAVALHRGDFLAGFSLRDSLAFDDWQLFECEALRGEMGSALEKLVRGHSARGEYEAAIDYARRWLTLDPLHEAGHRHLMWLYTQVGQRAAALRQYVECERALRQEVGVEPAPETVELYKAIRMNQPLPSVMVAGMATSVVIAPLPEDPALRADNLPAPATSFVGRERELAELGRLLAEPGVRLVTVVGTGGMGKTRLALEAARAALSGYPGGAWLVELAPLPAVRGVPGAAGDSAVDGEPIVPRAVAAALGVQERLGRPLAETISGALHGRELLLVLDNCEHVLAGVAPLVALLLARCPELTVLATSREPLSVTGEYLYDVPPMECPTPEDLSDLEKPDKSLLQYSAVQLLAQRAAAVRPGFALAEDNAAVVADICRRLDGMPLAIELAAARLRALSLPELALHLDDRLHFLTGGSRAAQPRQQTLRNTVAWSYDLLNSAEQAMFDRLSIFAGSFSLEGAEAVCSGGDIERGEVLELLAALVDQSLVGRVDGPEDATRYWLLETLRAYGQERLEERGEKEEVAARHAGYYVSFVEALDPVLQAFEREAIVAFRRLDAEDENLAAATRWSLAQGQPEVTMRIGAALAQWLLCRVHYSTQYDEWLRAALQQGQGVAPRYQARALSWVADFRWNRGRRGSGLAALAQAAFEQAQASGDVRQIGRALYEMGRVAAAAGDNERARACYHESLALARQCGDRQLAYCDSVLDLSYEPPARRRVLLEELLEWAPYGGHAWVHQTLGAAAWALGDLAGARASLQASIARWGEFGHLSRQGDLHVELAEIDLLRGDYASAERLLQRGMDMERRAGASYCLVWGAQMRGRLAWECGHLEQARQRLEEGLLQARLESMVQDAALCRVDLALVASERGDYELAEALCAEALPDLPPGDIWVRGGGNWARGHAFLAQARVALGRGQGGRAVALCREALGWVQQARFRPEIVDVLEPLSWALAVGGRAMEAARLLALTEREREEMGIVLPPVDRPHRERALEVARVALSEEGFGAAWAEGRARDLEETVRELLLEQGQGDDA